jgi:hypothetical protein
LEAGSWVLGQIFESLERLRVFSRKRVSAFNKEDKNNWQNDDKTPSKLEDL